MQNFYPTELAYLSTFCTCTPQPWGVRLRDSALHDMFSHNLTYIERPLPDEALFSLFLQERRLRRAEGEQYLNLTLERAPSTRLLQRFARMGCVRTVYDYYLYTGKTARSVGNCAAVPMTPAKRGAALSVDVRVTGGAGGENRLPLPRGGADGIVRGVQTGTHGALKGLGEGVCQIRQGDERIPLGSSGSCQRGQRQQKPKQEGGGFFHKDSFLQIAIAP